MVNVVLRAIRTTRFGIAAMIFTASLINFIMNINMSLNIVVMMEPILKNKNNTGQPHEHVYCRETFYNDIKDPAEKNFGTKYKWGATESTIILASYFWGYAVSSLFGGILAERLGPTRIVLIATVCFGVLTTLGPPLANLSWIALMLSRAIIGLFAGVIFPCLHCLISKWAPPNEKGKFMTSLMGGPLGVVLGWSLIGAIISDLGWVWSFYINGIIVLLWCILWYFTVTDTPAEHPRISEEEKLYIISSLGDRVAHKHLKSEGRFAEEAGEEVKEENMEKSEEMEGKKEVSEQNFICKVKECQWEDKRKSEEIKGNQEEPTRKIVRKLRGNCHILNIFIKYNAYLIWTLNDRSICTKCNATTQTWPPYTKILLSTPFWALVCLHFGNMWGLFFIMTAEPLFIKSVLGIEIGRIGILASIPYIAKLITGFGFGATAHIIPGMLLYALIVTGCNIYWIIGIQTLSLGCNGAATITNLQNVQDLAPNYAGTISSIVGSIGTTPGVIVTTIVGILTKDDECLHTWYICFSIGGTVYIVTGMIFCIFGSGEIQPWNELPHQEVQEPVQENTEPN